MNNKSNFKEPEKPVKNTLTEKVKDFVKSVILTKGDVLLEMKEKESAIIVPEGYENSDYVYYQVVKLGNDEFKKIHPEFVDEGRTKVGNIVLVLTPTHTPILTNNGKKYILIHESLIKLQVAPENFVA